MITTHTLDAVLNRNAALVAASIQNLLARYNAGDDAFYDLVRYHLGLLDADLRPLPGPPGGKGLRASLVMLVAEAFGGSHTPEDAAPLAAAVELLHNFSLLHDDIEDGSTTRRRRPTVWSLWGAPLAINAGDGLYALAHKALLDAPLRRRTPASFITVMDHFEDVTLKLCEGQHLDMVLEGRAVAEVAVDTYLRMVSGKSAALIGSAAWVGAMAADASPAHADIVYRWGVEIGMAFQMQDDVLGIWGDEAVTGKSATGDIASRKKTLPVLLALQQLPVDARARLRDLYGLPSSAANDDAILAMLDHAGARDLTATYLLRYQDSAARTLAELPTPSVAREMLTVFADRFVDRAA